MNIEWEHDEEYKDSSGTTHPEAWYAKSSIHSAHPGHWYKIARLGDKYGFLVYKQTFIGRNFSLEKQRYDTLDAAKAAWILRFGE